MIKLKSSVGKKGDKIIVFLIFPVVLIAVEFERMSVIEGLSTFYVDKGI